MRYYFDERGEMLINGDAPDGSYAGFSGKLYDTREEAVAAGDGQPSDDDGWVSGPSGLSFTSGSAGETLKDSWVIIDGEWYRFDENGSMLTGYFSLDGDDYYLGSDGALRCMCQVPDGRYADSDGILRDEPEKTDEEIEAESQDALAAAAVQWAMSKKGAAYSQEARFGANTFDCSSLVLRAYRSVGIDISYQKASTAAYEAMGLINRGCEVGRNDVRPGDLIFYKSKDAVEEGRFKGIGHVAMYIGNGQVVNARGEKSGVVISGAAISRAVCICRPSLLS